MYVATIILKGDEKDMYIKLDRKKIEIAKARACMSTNELCAKGNIPHGTYCRVLGACSCKPETAGKIARALGKIRDHDLSNGAVLHDAA